MNNQSESQKRMIDIYRRQAKGYDTSGIRGLELWRKEAINRLNLRCGDLVVDIGCGTGLNFALLQAAIGSEGQIIGVDLTDAMLDQARQRVAEHGWQNVALVQSDATQYEFPDRVDGIIATFTLSFVLDCGRVIQNGCRALEPGRKWVVLDMAWPDGWPMLLRHGLFFLRSWGITADLIQRRPWQAAWQALNQHLVGVQRKHLWMGFFHLAFGTRPP